MIDLRKLRIGDILNVSSLYQGDPDYPESIVYGRVLVILKKNVKLICVYDSIKDNNTVLEHEIFFSKEKIKMCSFATELEKALFT